VAEARTTSVTNLGNTKREHDHIVTRIQATNKIALDARLANAHAIARVHSPVAR
jgi:hypothetical protein